MIPIRSVKFWINAFIPRNVADYTLPVPAGPHVGETMIPGPNLLSDCYLTDQRDFSNAIHAKSRMHSEFKIEVAGAQYPMRQWHNCDLTTECDCEDGEVECTKKGDTGRMRFTRLTNRVCAPGVLIIEASLSASNPCAPTSRAFGDIDIRGNITVSLPRRSVSFQGMIDQFPAFEAYATINDGAGQTLFRVAPPAGNTVMNLPGASNRPVSGSVTFS